MKFIQFIIISFLCFSCASQKESVIKKDTGIKIMTYNIRLDVASDGENAWGKRSDFLSSQILFLSPDVFGVQEARPNQIEDLNAALADYKFIGEGRDGNGKGEFSAIYYNSNSVTLERENTFWLSNTPNEVSKGWDAAYPRVCTYGLFSSKKSLQKFWVFNTHLDHVGKEAQKEGMKKVLEKIAKENMDNYPVILTGDFNVESDSEVIAEISNTMLDSEVVTKLKFGPHGTFNAFKYKEPVTRRIDYIFVSKSPKVSVHKYAVLSSAIDFKFPSDHFPVFVEIEMK